MIDGIGLDIIETKRIEGLLLRQSKFVDRILTLKEKETFCKLSAKRKIEFISGRFAAKEAYAKATGTGIGKKLSFLDIEILNNEAGKPEIFLMNSRADGVHLSITHTKNYAAAQVIIESLSS
ncbi:holo-ACP synthase [Metabacillus arenae]|uniref:Holo-[acyl-carrier-protein] synthase n=1 Tax=Metabacillus arenae TaxID=2771434 RepID=A0A926NIU7_9BACI|nr:holo-ACP synthase [Metabacillus arenae]MBD1382151.1 holo-ACP synthase [Metabacillus arenae]